MDWLQLEQVVYSKWDARSQDLLQGPADAQGWKYCALGVFFNQWSTVIVKLAMTFVDCTVVTNGCLRYIHCEETSREQCVLSC